MHAFQITITLRDGSRGVHQGIYTSGCAAVIVAIGHFPDARSISARRLA